ncbi:ECF-type sigma factor [Bowmanella dokdonensis]|uniref:Sigma-70 family RNA polymerase sigma factor n=1 Tax=Bowmanella dokdonensis TaxID=751969 RepID=A0A939IML2_9ALTE|nr:ECF-type sigma factor [Bowmanella dokdonensis]MBN7825418.1 sigma-70 family RNA polymerase sigma factor [Bowmanella dokdonensis]
MKRIAEEELTMALNAYQQKSLVEQNQLMSKIYHQLRRAACVRLRQFNGADLSPTVLVHESFLKLFANEQTWHNRDHFFAVASTAMRQIMVDIARGQNALKRGGNVQEVTYSEELAASDDKEQQVLQVNEILAELEAANPDLVRIVELKFYMGLSNEEVAEALNVSRRTVHRRWDEAKALIQTKLAGG